ncbi:hypothetical protein [Microcoleus sp. B7-D4]|uniref:hypothetical protein n=1 Tax=Microcoleus sp. B7-D4 TaxID=2818696 RepID=UPI002FD41BE3
MTASYPLTNGLPIPNDFPIENYEKISSLVRSKIDLTSDTNRSQYSFFSASWKGFLYRFLACTEHDEKYRQSVLPVGKKYSPYERYVVEQELFDFLVNGLSAIECLCCALCAIGAIEVTQTRQATDNSFLIDREEYIKKITPRTTALNFEKKFPNAPITTSLKNLFEKSSETENAVKYEDWKKIRNYLAHRFQPGRMVPISSTGVSNHDVPESWNLNSLTNEDLENLPNIEFTDTTTASRREWLTKIIRNILSESYIFVNSSPVTSESLAMPLPLEQLSEPLTDGVEG